MPRTRMSQVLSGADAYRDAEYPEEAEKYAAEFDEQKHPRDHGKFTSGAGQGGSGPDPESNDEMQAGADRANAAQAGREGLSLEDMYADTNAPKPVENQLVQAAAPELLEAVKMFMVVAAEGKFQSEDERMEFFHQARAALRKAGEDG